MLFERRGLTKENMRGQSYDTTPQLQNFENSVRLVTLKNVLQLLHGIAAKLQKRDIDIYESFCNIDSAINDVTSNRLNIDTRYPVWYQ